MVPYLLEFHRQFHGIVGIETTCAGIGPLIEQTMRCLILSRVVCVETALELSVILMYLVTRVECQWLSDCARLEVFRMKTKCHNGRYHWCSVSSRAFPAVVHSGLVSGHIQQLEAVPTVGNIGEPALLRMEIPFWLQLIGLKAKESIESLLSLGVPDFVHRKQECSKYSPTYEYWFECNEFLFLFFISIRRQSQFNRSLAEISVSFAIFWDFLAFGSQ